MRMPVPKQCLSIVRLTLLLSVLARPAYAMEADGQQPTRAWQVHINTNVVYDLATIDGDYTWATTWGGVVCYGNGEYIQFTTTDGLTDNDVRAIAVEAGDGGERLLWFGTYGRGVSVLKGGGTPLDKDDDMRTTYTTDTTDDGLASNRIWAIIVEHMDDEDRLWFGTAAAG